MVTFVKLDVDEPNSIWCHRMRTDGRLVGRMDGRTDGRTDGPTDRTDRTDGQTDAQRRSHACARMRACTCTDGRTDGLTDTRSVGRSGGREGGRERGRAVNYVVEGRWRAVNYVVDAFFVLDLVLTFFTVYEDPHTGHFVRNRSKIAKHYLKGASRRRASHGLEPRSGATV